MECGGGACERVSVGLSARGVDAGVQACRRAGVQAAVAVAMCIRALFLHPPQTLPLLENQTKSKKIKECPRRVGVPSSLLSPGSRLSKLGGPCSIGMNRRNLAKSERAAPPPTLCYPPRRRRHCLPDHAQRRIPLRSPGIPAIGHRRSAQVAAAAARPRTHDLRHVYLRRCQRTQPPSIGAHPPFAAVHTAARSSHAPTPQRRC